MKLIHCLILLLRVSKLASRILSLDDFNEVLDKLIDKIQTQFFQANAQGQIDVFLEKLGYSFILEESIPSYSFINIRNARILVLAYRWC